MSLVAMTLNLVAGQAFFFVFLRGVIFIVFFIVMFEEEPTAYIIVCLSILKKAPSVELQRDGYPPLPFPPPCTWMNATYVHMFALCPII